MNAIYNLGPRLDLAKRWGEEKLAGGELDNKQFNDFVARRAADRAVRGCRTPRYSPRVLKDGADFGRRPGCPEPGLSQHRPLQRGVDPPLQPDRRRQADHADRDRRRAGEVQLLAGDRGADAADRALLPQGRPARQAGRRAGRRAAPDARMRPCSSAARPCSPSAARAAIRARRPSRPPGSTRAAARGRTTCSAGTGTGSWTKTDEYQGEDEGDRPRPRLPRRQLSLGRVPRAGDAAADQRLQPARDQRDRRQHLGQLLLADLQEPALGRHGHGAPSDHRRAERVSDAGRRPRLHAPAVADQPVVDGALPAQQHRRPLRPRPVGRGAAGRVPGRHRADALAREAGEGPGPRRQGAGHHRPDDGAQLPDHPGRLPARAAGRRCSSRSATICGPSTSAATSRSGRSRPACRSA